MLTGRAPPPVPRVRWWPQGRERPREMGLSDISGPGPRGPSGDRPEGRLGLTFCLQLFAISVNWPTINTLENQLSSVLCPSVRPFRQPKATSPPQDLEVWGAELKPH
jgi:hypothetical protein